MPSWMPEKRLVPKQILTCGSKPQGWTHSHLALLLDAELKSMDLLKPVAQFAHDPMHGVLQGIAPICLFHWLSSMENDLDIWAFLQGYFPLWQYPKSWKTPELGTFFQKKKIASYKKQPENQLPS